MGKWNIPFECTEKNFELVSHIKDLEERIFQIERENIECHGYGIKGSILSLLEISARNFNNHSEIDEIFRIIKIV